MPNDPVLNLVELEIKRLHQFLEGWLNGGAQRSEAVFTESLTDILHPAFVNIQPAGILLGRDQLLDQIRDGHGASPDFRIRIRNVVVRQSLDSAGTILATYEEYQKGARNSTRSDNARLSSALFQRESNDRLIWLHIHETWLPEAKHAEACFQF